MEIRCGVFCFVTGKSMSIEIQHHPKFPRLQQARVLRFDLRQQFEHVITNSNTQKQKVQLSFLKICNTISFLWTVPIPGDLIRVHAEGVQMTGARQTLANIIVSSHQGNLAVTTLIFRSNLVWGLSQLHWDADVDSPLYLTVMCNFLYTCLWCYRTGSNFGEMCHCNRRA